MLQEGEKGKAQLVYINPDADFATYDKITLDPVIVLCSKDSKSPREDIYNLASQLHYKVIAKLEEDFEIVQTPGSGVMRVSVALTEAKKSKARHYCEVGTVIIGPSVCAWGACIWKR